MAETLTREILARDHPELLAEIEAAAAAAERERIQAIEALALPGTEELIARSKFDPEMTAGRVATEVVRVYRTSPQAFTAAMMADGEAPLGPDVDPTPPEHAA